MIRLVLLAVAAFGGTASAQSLWTSVGQVNQGAANCTPGVTSVSVVNGGTEVQVQATNGTSNWISAGMSVRFVAPGLDRTVSMASWSDPRSPGGSGVFRITGISPTLPPSIPNATVTVTTNCAVAPNPSGPPRNWR